MHFQGSTILALIAGAVAAPFANSDFSDSGLLTERANSDFQEVGHNTIKYIPTNIRGGVEGNAIRRYEPFLHIASGCQSYPAVSASGQVGGGLQNSGSQSGGCNDPANGQTYVRGAWHGGRYAIMYAWYFPKDQTTAGGLNGGHRHDWESVVIWIDNPANANPRVFGAAASGHGGYKKTANPQMRDGSRLQVEYFTNAPTNHELQFKTSPGGDHDMIDYATVSPAIRKAFDEYNWGSANCPFNAGNFNNNLNKAAV